MVFSFNRLTNIDEEIIKFNNMISQLISPYPVSYLLKLTGFEWSSMNLFKDVYIIKRSFIRYIRLGVPLGLEFNIIESNIKENIYETAS